MADKNRKRNKKISLDGICDAFINKTYNYGLTEPLKVDFTFMQLQQPYEINLTITSIIKNVCLRWWKGMNVYDKNIF